MKAYKASYNGICRDFKYEVGETYEMDNIMLCERGFHACRNMVDTLFYYEYTKDFVLFEVEILGQIIEGEYKLVTDKIEIIRVVPPEEYEDFKVDDRGNLLHRKYSDGYEVWYEYNLNNKCTHTRDSNRVGFCREYDERNNCIHYKESLGIEWWKKYDINNNCIYYKNSSGTEWWKEYDERNNLIHNKNANGEEIWREYNINNNCIHYKSSAGTEWWKEYDEKNNLVYKKVSDGVEYKITIE